MGIVENDKVYYYVTNLQGDVVGIVDKTGQRVVTYTYDAWGNVLSITGSKADTLGAVNPIRYHGYVLGSTWPLERNMRAEYSTLIMT